VTRIRLSKAKFSCYSSSGRWFTNHEQAPFQT
jgi:hypothetical protein